MELGYNEFGYDKHVYNKHGYSKHCLIKKKKVVLYEVCRLKKPIFKRRSLAEIVKK